MYVSIEIYEYIITYTNGWITWDLVGKKTQQQVVIISLQEDQIDFLSLVN